ncbi:MAG TPA: hypothetical protein VFS44_02975 [Gemmatimonadaceae bacterium]|nr:hypothetical protein [Gemmatimonadaceae bacterium]
MFERRLAGAALLVLAAACGGSTDPGDGGTPGDQLHFLRPAADAPALVSSSVTFWAYRDRDSQGVIWYHKRADQSDSSEFVEFRVPSQSIAQDSVQITMTVVDPTRLVVEFQPSGLQFASDRPARLKLKYAEADADLNDDGIVNATDAALKALLSIWRQEQPGDPWVKVPSTSVTLDDDVEADIFGFTRYAIAY